jgi:hypothetical protein
MVVRELQLNAAPTLPQKGRVNMKKACYLMKSIGEGQISIHLLITGLSSENDVLRARTSGVYA